MLQRSTDSIVSEGMGGYMREVEPSFNLLLALSRSSILQSLEISPRWCCLSEMVYLSFQVCCSCRLSGRRRICERRLVKLGFLRYRGLDTLFMWLFPFDPGRFTASSVFQLVAMAYGVWLGGDGTGQHRARHIVKLY
ncbi:uncharacterized protein LOC132311071 [Cornus florida]|uniref:uncharacterized protein LOC132311071 n=1 Tax=Cornus florida TaxID=4283 RepID=UPI0028A2B097|nr:uncharacterized protein LOC132311071 [Cornus florida]